MKRLIALVVGLVLFLHFILFALSIWPYQRLSAMVTTHNDQGRVVKVESDENKKIIKSNVYMYVSINVGIMVVGLSASILLGRKRKLKEA